MYLRSGTLDVEDTRRIKLEQLNDWIEYDGTRGRLRLIASCPP